MSKYKGSAHKTCNTMFYYEKSLNVFFHNLKGYDSHFLIQKGGKFNKKIGVIPNNTEKFLSFNIDKVKFKDSYQFLMTSLDSLTRNLVKKEITENNPDVLKNLSSESKDEQLQLLKRKGIFPYDYLDSSIDLMKHHYQIKKCFIIGYTTITFHKKNMIML